MWGGHSRLGQTQSHFVAGRNSGRCPTPPGSQACRRLAQEQSCAQRGGTYEGRRAPILVRTSWHLSGAGMCPAKWRGFQQGAQCAQKGQHKGPCERGTDHSVRVSGVCPLQWQPSSEMAREF